MISKFVTVALLAASALSVPLNKVHEISHEHATLFTNFKSQFNKAYYDDSDESYRKQIFSNNLNFIRQHNEEAKAGVHTYTLAMNEFGDMTFEEFHTKFTGFSGARGAFSRSQNVEDLSSVKPLASVDWTTKGAVTEVKNQGQCGSCWSFSTTGSIEGAWFLAGNDLVSLSEKQLMDCSRSEGNNGCEGGLMDYAFEYVISNGGICSEQEYPYKPTDEGSCNSSCNKVAHISAYHDVTQSESALEAAVTKTPVSVAIEADQQAFQFYSSGVMTGECGTQLDHGVLAVGYGNMDGTDYWKVKNSWGETWGMSGYILLEKGKSQSGGQCGILMASSYPVV